jgi:large subunit ribosomal protein L19
MTVKNKYLALVEASAVQHLEATLRKRAEEAAAKKEEAAKKDKGDKKEKAEKVEDFHYAVPQFEIGDTVDVFQRILEGNKERLQVFSGTVIARRGSGMSEMFTVRRIVQGEGVERVFPLHSPRIARVEVKRSGRVRRAKLFYLRKRVGKATRLRERKPKAAAPAAPAEAAKT